jgi:hypothetical protein
VKRALPYLVAFAVPAVTLTAVYLAIGASVYAAVVGGVLVGTIGSGGAALAELVRRMQRAAEERDFDRVVGAIPVLSTEELFQPKERDE